MSQLACIACGGALGAVSRFLISKQVNQLCGGSFPYGTLCVNILGALLIGFLFSLFDYSVVPRGVKSFLSIGLLGALTTFSTFSLETVSLLRGGEYLEGLLNVCLNVLLSLFMVIVGIKLFALIVNSIHR